MAIKRRRPHGFPRRPKKKRRPFKSYEPAIAIVRDGLLRMLLPRKLLSLNRLRKSRLAFHADTKAWEKMLREVAFPENDNSLAFPSKIRMRLEIDRLAPRTQYFLDRTNLAGGVKGLEDALVRLGYLKDDAERWLDGPHVSNQLSTDGKYWTVIRITIAEPYE